MFSTTTCSELLHDLVQQSNRNWTRVDGQRSDSMLMFTGVRKGVAVIRQTSSVAYFSYCFESSLFHIERMIYYRGPGSMPLVRCWKVSVLFGTVTWTKAMFTSCYNFGRLSTRKHRSTSNRRDSHTWLANSPRKFESRAADAAWWYINTSQLMMVTCSRLQRTTPEWVFLLLRLSSTFLSLRIVKNTPCTEQ